MGFLDRFRSKSPTLVRITFRDIGEPEEGLHGRGYVYAWALEETPEVGQRVRVPGMDGPAWAMVIGVDDATPDETGAHEVKNVTRLATSEEVAKAQAKSERELNGWLDMMRRAAGLATPGRARQKVPPGFPEIPPADGTAAPEVAAEYGSAWFRAFKSARVEDETKKFKSLAYRWYAIRDRGH